ncbi:division abnormally delayed protein isoform X1 [Euwallacea fornicatus]|uniref:division abnormally delayed protein isoform X1 n=1 Tax=Euwallacea fornicatus TaxID=995702 RepID=UPI00338F3DF3
MASPAAGSPRFVIFVLLCIVCATFAKNVDTSRYKRQDADRKSCNSMQYLLAETGMSSVKNEKGPICNGECCDSDTELYLTRQGQKDLSEILSHNSKSLLGPISRAAGVLKYHVRELTQISENKTLVMFSQLYRNMPLLSKEVLHILYRDIREYIRIEPQKDKPATGPEDIVRTVERFFTDLFPVAFLAQLNEPTKGDFNDRYKQCLKENMEEISPFGNFPKEIANSLSKSLEATRLLLQAFDIGMEVLNTTDKLIISDHTGGSTECHSALLKMMYCSKCQGFRNSKPCSGYCLNVLRGCTSKYVAELDLPWSSYVEGIESLVNAIKRTSNSDVNVDMAIRNLESQIPAAIMHLMERQAEIVKKVKINCKMPVFLEEGHSTVEATTIASIMKNRVSPTKSYPHFPEAHFSSFLSTMSKTKGFYADLADTLCGEETFADQRDKKCWNGERIGEYTKTIVGSAKDMQKYNPEVKQQSSLQQVDPTIANLVDKLRHVHHMAVSSLGPNYTEDYMQRDGVDGSGSGNGPDIGDDEDDTTRGSGSGNGPIEPEETVPRTHATGDTVGVAVNQPTSVRTSGSCCIAPAITLSTIITMVLALLLRY